MTDRTQEELLRQLHALDNEILSLLSNYAEKRNKATAVRGVITGLFGTVAGLALTANYFFPETSETVVAVASVVAGALVAALTYFSQQKADDKVIQILLKNRSHLTQSAEAISREKAQLIERFLKAEGL